MVPKQSICTTLFGECRANPLVVIALQCLFCSLFSTPFLIVGNRLTKVAKLQYNINP